MVVLCSYVSRILTYRCIQIYISYSVIYLFNYFLFNYKNYNFLDCDWFKKLLFSTNSLAKLFYRTVVMGQFVIGQFNKPITFKVVL